MATPFSFENYIFAESCGNKTHWINLIPLVFAAFYGRNKGNERFMGLDFTLGSHQLKPGVTPDFLVKVKWCFRWAGVL